MLERAAALAAVGLALAQGRACSCAASTDAADGGACSRPSSPQAAAQELAGIAVIGHPDRARRPTRSRRGSPMSLGLFLVLCEADREKRAQRWSGHDHRRRTTR